MLTGLVVFSALAAYTTLMQFAAHRSDGPDKQATAWHASKQRLDKARTAAGAITARPPAIIEPLIGPARVDKLIWTRTAGCTDVTRPDSKAFCLMIDRLRGKLKQAREKKRLLDIVTRETATMDRLGPPQESHPGAAGIARLTGYSRDEVRYGMFAFAGLLIELVATFGLLLGARSKPKRKAKNGPPGSIYEALKLKVDENGNVTTSYRMLADTRRSSSRLTKTATSPPATACWPRRWAGTSKAKSRMSAGSSGDWRKSKKTACLPTSPRPPAPMCD